jgi:thioredoxin-like negative regulator of GroEL
LIEALLQAERLLVHGLVDQAEDLFRRSAEQDPRNAIAVVGLARVAIERGDDHLAYRRACDALRIDPENDAALRLEARLSEILATRGEPVERPEWLIGPSAAPATPASPARPAAATPAREARPSEQVAFSRNPTMDDHRRRTEQAARPAAPAARADATRRPRKSRGLIRRLLGG